MPELNKFEWLTAATTTLFVSLLLSMWVWMMLRPEFDLLMVTTAIITVGVLLQTVFLMEQIKK